MREPSLANLLLENRKYNLFGCIYSIMKKEEDEGEMINYYQITPDEGIKQSDEKKKKLDVLAKFIRQ